MSNKINAVKGMNDILPPQSALWEWFEAHVRAVMGQFAYRLVRTPVVEYTPLFVKGTGETTDIVEKEMYSFEDRLNGEHLTLRPENTPGVVRAAIEHNLTFDGGKRLYYMGPMFRHERPQRGRFRQFYQLGVEALGFGGPEIDAETMLLAHRLLQRLGVRDVRVELNSLGLLPERLAHRAALVAYFEGHLDKLDADSQRRLVSNPLRILDTKNPAMQELVQAAPVLASFLSEASLKRLEVVQSILTAEGVGWQINHRLVRGLDYYSHTVFEFVTDALGAQGTLCGGGRYDGLTELLGGKPSPGVGWGLGIERVLDLVQTQALWQPEADLDAYAIVTEPGAWPQILPVLSALRACGVRVQMNATTDGEPASMKSQMKRADASGARFALIFGGNEMAAQSVAVRDLRAADPSAQQRNEAWANVGDWAQTLQAVA
jgi:histidyl-tRNA synthetase